MNHSREAGCGSRTTPGLPHRGRGDGPADACARLVEPPRSARCPPGRRASRPPCASSSAPATPCSSGGGGNWSTSTTTATAHARPAAPRRPGQVRRRHLVGDLGHHRPADRRRSPRGPGHLERGAAARPGAATATRKKPTSPSPTARCPPMMAGSAAFSAPSRKTRNGFSASGGCAPCGSCPPGPRGHGRSSKPARAATDTLAQNPHDLPFALIYLLDGEGKVARLAGATGLPDGSPARPASIDLTSSDGRAACWPLRPGCGHGPGRVGGGAGGPLRSPAVRRLAGPAAAGHRPARMQPGQDRLAGFLVAGISPRRVFDDDYRGFIDLLAGHVATAVANAGPTRRRSGGPRRWPNSTGPRRRSSRTSATSSARR